MNNFFSFLCTLSRYLYLMFDEDNFIHDKPYVFTTEAHPFMLPPRKRGPLGKRAEAQQMGPGEGAASGQKRASLDFLSFGINTRNSLNRGMANVLGVKKREAAEMKAKEGRATLWTR